MPEHIKRCPRRLRGLGGLVGRSVDRSTVVSTRDRGDTCNGKTEAEEAEKQQVEDTQAEGGGGGLLEEGETAIDGRRLEEIGLEDLAVDEQCS